MVEAVLHCSSPPAARFAQSEARTGVAVQELNPGLLKGPSDCLHGFFGNQAPLFFKVDHRGKTEVRSARQFRLRQIQKRAGSSTLGRSHFQQFLLTALCSLANNNFC